MDQYPWTIRFRSRTGCCQATSGKRFDLVGYPACGFAEDGEVPQERFAPFPVGFKLADGHVGDQVLGPLGRVDHLGEQEDVTLHIRAWLRP
jgi:hypothetical protein